MSGTEQAAGRDANGGARRIIDTSVAHSAHCYEPSRGPSAAASA